MSRKLKFIDRFNYKIHSFIALSIVWLGGVVMLIYLLFFFENEKSLKNKTDFIDFSGSYSDKPVNITGDTQTNSNGVSDAYVFVNINKKHILTKFVSFTPSESENNLTVNSYPNSSVVKKINKIQKNKPENKPSDFSIKPAPEL